MTDFLLLAGSLLLASLLIGRSKPGFIWVIAAILVAVAGAAFAALAGSFISGFAPQLLGLAGAASIGAKLLLIFFVLIVLFDVITDKKLDKRGAIALFIIPALVLLTSGPLATMVSSAYGGLRDTVVSAFTSI